MVLGLSAASTSYLSGFGAFSKVTKDLPMRVRVTL